ncbi:RagB/SusD family nutrient uptake outer membrane protein [Sphingobacterium sp. E70]|uniref:RagB/SusD family nutrient uptake outer membrane protein n=1 Tax=Sphingobacterium sp. E70 TaxID=2853439 RepID=UPI00211D1024|nr:RagB/SusD family nutrient uptake outer membrane protein [Sphingobacterium sp. E70]ULT28150.1 RagB/SusD family nutrient uptake outer membrane protein [Sphingobacterium sp. E70]
MRYIYNTRMNAEKTIADDNDGWGTDDWAALRSINYFLDHYKTVEAVTSFDAVKQYVGEALFFRAGFYFTKLKNYGDLPWAETTVGMDSEVLKAARIPRNQIVENILADLDKAVDYLPSGKGGWTGRLTKETAMALQSRIALYEGTWEKYHAADNFRPAVNKSQQFLEKAAAVSGQLIALSESTGYPALDNVGVENGYRDLFNQENYSTSKEVMFWRKYEAGAVNSIWDRYSANGAGRGATKNLVDSYLKADGKPVAAGYDDSSLQKIVENRDPRLGQTIQINDKNIIDGIRQARLYISQHLLLMVGIRKNLVQLGIRSIKGITSVMRMQGQLDKVYKR